MDCKLQFEKQWFIPKRFHLSILGLPSGATWNSALHSTCQILVFEALPALSSSHGMWAGSPVLITSSVLLSFACKLSSSASCCPGGPCSPSRCSAPLVASMSPRVKQPNPSIFLKLPIRCTSSPEQLLLVSSSRSQLLSGSLTPRCAL